MRLFRLLKKQNAVLLFFADIAFSLFAAVAVCILFFNLSNGKMRAYPLVLIAVWFLICRFAACELCFEQGKACGGSVFRAYSEEYLHRGLLQKDC